MKANNTPANMEAKNISAAIIAELNQRKDRSAWDKAVTAYAIELAERLDGCSLISDLDIAKRVCSPSELKRVTNKRGLRDMANPFEHWLDTQARALCQAYRRVADIAAKYLNA